MKREFIKELLPDITPETLDAIMAENGKDIEGPKNAVTQLTTERDALKTQLEAVNAEVKTFKDLDVDGIKAKASEWETKYNAETQALKAQLDAEKYGFSVKEAVSGMKFTSESARKAFIADLTAKNLPMQEGKLLGMADFQKAYQEADPGAFAPADDDTVVITKGGTGGTGGAGSSTDAALREAMGLPPKKD